MGVRGVVRVLALAAAVTVASGLLTIAPTVVGAQTGSAAHPAPEKGGAPKNILGLPSQEVRGAPAESTPRSLTQPDGTTFTAHGFGDAKNHGIETKDGHEIVQDRSKRWVYVDGSGPGGQRKASNRVVGQQAPPADSNIVAATADHNTGTALAAEAQATGSQPTLVILARFTNQPSVGSTAADWSSKYFGATNSVRSFYQQASYGQLDFAPATETSGANDGVVGWVDLPYVHPNFQGDYDTPVNGVVWEEKVTKDAITAANPYINYAAYDTNGDGYIKPAELHITVIMAGYESAISGACGPSVWGHKSSLSSAYTPTVDGKFVGYYGYTQFGEWHRSCSTGAGSGNLATIGIMAHEIGHDIGWPDLYDTVPGGSNTDSEGIGRWSLMSSGAWNFASGQHSGDSPALPDAWSKYFQGWVTPTAVGTSPSSVSLRSASSYSDVARLLDNPNGVDWYYGHPGTGEYFLVENRQKTGYDAGLPGCGLLIWHIDETRVGTNAANSVETRRLVDLEQADGRKDLNGTGNRGDTGDPYPGLTANLSFNSASNPNSQLYNGALSGVSVSLATTTCQSTMSATMSTGGGSVAPANDAFAGASVLASGSGTSSGTSVGASKEAGEPPHAGNAGGKSIWYSWTAPATGTLTVSTAGSGFDTLLGIYQGTAVNGLTERGSNDDEDNAGGIVTSKVTNLAVTGGATYRIAVDGFNAGGGAASGAVQMALTFTAPPPANDNFAASTSLSGSSGTASGSSVAATKEGGEPSHAGNSGGKSVWYSWTATMTGVLHVSTQGSNFDTLLGVYQGSSVGALTSLASNDDEDTASGVVTSLIDELPVTNGQVYRIAVDGYNGAGGAASGTVQLAWSVSLPVPPPANDTFASASAISGATGSTTGTTAGATKQAGEPAHGGNVGGASVWYSWTAPGNGTLDATTQGSSIDTLLGVYQGTVVSSLTLLADNDDDPLGGTTSHVTGIDVTAGQKYRIAVDAYKPLAGPPQTGPITLGWTFTPSPTVFTPLSPARVLDTRIGLGRAGTARVAAGGTVALDVTGVGGVPASNVSSVILNVTVTGPTSTGYATVYPNGQPRPTASNLNFTTNQTIPNLVVAKVGTSGIVNLYTTANTHLIADIVGYFPTTSEFSSLTPARVLDTRIGLGRAGTARVAAGGTVALDVTGVGGVPASNVSSVILNVTVTGPTSTGYATVYPNGQPRPTASNLNFTTNQTIPNLVVAKVGTSGIVNLYTTANTHLIADIVGYFPTTSEFSSLTPARVLDTRIGLGRAGTARVAAGGTVALDVTGVGGVPASNVSSVILNVTVTGPTSTGYATVYPNGQPRPTASNLNFTTNQTIPNLVVAKVGTSGIVNLYTTANTHLIADIVGYFPTT